MNTSEPIVQGRFVEPDVVTTHFHFREGDAVADFGAGSGYFLESFSKAVGLPGRVYACEVQRELVEKMGNLVQSKGLNNIDPLWCDIEEAGGVKIADGVLDAVTIINTLFQLDDKDATIKEAARTLRPGGKLIVIDWSESFSGLGPQPAQVVTQPDAQALVESNNFVFERSFDSGDHHYGLTFKKP